MGNEKLVLTDRPEFVADFLERHKTTHPERLAEMVWNFANEVYRKGYDQGKYDPDFEASGDL